MVYNTGVLSMITTVLSCNSAMNANTHRAVQHNDKKSTSSYNFSHDREYAAHYGAAEANRAIAIAKAQAEKEIRIAEFEAQKSQNKFGK